jgi:hypothetical protein
MEIEGASFKVFKSEFGSFCVSLNCNLFFCFFVSEFVSEEEESLDCELGLDALEVLTFRTLFF